jgi:hypothetical protein
MSNYTKATNFATKDALSSGDPLKIVKGTEINTEFDSIATAIATKADLASPTFTGTPSLPTGTTAVTQSTGDDSTKLATTAFVQAELDTLGTISAQNANNVLISGGSVYGVSFGNGNNIQALFEKVVTTASAPSSTTNFDILTQSVKYYTSNATNNFTLNVRGAESASAVSAGSFVVGTYYTITVAGNTDFTLIGASSNDVGTGFYATGVGAGTGTATAVTSLNNLMATGKSISIALIVKNGSASSSGTYARSGTTVTVTIASHGLTTGAKVTLTFSAGTGGTATNGVYSVTVIGTDTFTVTDTASGTITNNPSVSMVSPYYPSALQIDGNSVTPVWQNGLSPTSGYVNSLDMYLYTIIKTGSATFTVFASQTKFA